MIAFEVRVNGKRVCVAGADDLGILIASVAAVGKLGKNTVSRRANEKAYEVHYSVGGLTSRPQSGKDVHLHWKSVERLKVGDAFQVRILQTEKVDRPTSRVRAKKKRG